MHIILIFSMLIGTFVISKCFRAFKRQKLAVALWCGLNLFLFGALRSTSTGIDIPNYVNMYSEIQHVSLSDILALETRFKSDLFFYVFLKLLSLICENPHFMLTIISAIVAVSFSFFIYKNSVNQLISFLMFLGLRYYSFTLSGLRQAVAWSIVLLSYESLKRRRLLRFTIIVIFASFFHKSAVFFLLAYPLSSIKRTTTINIITLTALLSYFIAGHWIIQTLTRMPLFQQYAHLLGEKTTSGTTTNLVYLCIITFATFNRKKIMVLYPYFYTMYNLTLTGFAITILVYAHASIFRLGYYFILPIILLLPICIKSTFSRHKKLMVEFVAIILLTGQFVFIGPGAGIENYYFFWK